MKYLIRTLKYLVYFAVMFFVIVGIIYLFSSQKAAGLSFSELFKEGSLPKIALFFVAVAAIYPKLNFQKRQIHINGDYQKYANIFEETMRSLEYEKESEEGTVVSFRKQGGFARFSRLYEDRVTFDTSDNPVIVDGYRKDLMRIISQINYKMREVDENQDQY